MSHNVERCDFIDMLEESAKLHRPVAVTLRGDTRFSDDVRDVVTEEGEDYALFREHGRVPVSDILDCVWTGPREQGYDSKL
jgi:Rho-binding antiterminator